MSMYYAEELIFTMCHYRLRYEYDYVLQFDVDEFFYLNKAIEQSLVSLPAILDKYFPPNSASLGVYQVRLFSLLFLDAVALKSFDV